MVALLIVLVIATLGFGPIGLLVFAFLKNDADPTGRRPYSLYLVAVNFLATFIIVFASFGIVSSLARAWTNHNSSSAGFEDVSGTLLETGSITSHGQTPDDALYSNAVQEAIVVLVAGAVLRFHSAKLKELRNEPTFASSPAARTTTAYAYLSCFLALVIAVASASTGLYALYEIAAPGVAGIGRRVDAVVHLIDFLYLGVAGVFVFKQRWPDGLSWKSLGVPGAPASSPPPSAL